MTDRQRELIKAYLPHPRDPELKDGEYYVLDTAWRVRKVEVRDLLPHKDYVTYGVYEVATGRRIDAGWGDVWIGFLKSDMYDNKEDCRNMEHSMYEDWEQLRSLQEQENET